jgi:hypothetical protein
MSNEHPQDQYHGSHPAAGNTALVERNAMEGTELAHLTDQAGVLAQQAVAAVQARYVLAVKRPRNIDAVRQNLLRECQRPSFAAVARYNKPVGDGIIGPSIRFAEAAIRCMGNIFVETMLVSDTEEKRVTRVVVSDLETNASYYKDITIEKVVERRNLRRGQKPLGQRHNSYGDLVYLVRATEDDILNKEGAQVSKAIRTCALRLLPGDILEEAMELVAQVQLGEVRRDPDKARKNAVDKFAQLGVTAEQLAKYLNRADLQGLGEREIAHLYEVYQTLRDGEATWADLMEASPYLPKDHAAPGDAPANAKAEELRQKIEQRSAQRQSTPPAQQSTPPVQQNPAPVPQEARPAQQETLPVQPAAEERQSVARTTVDLPEHVKEMLMTAAEHDLPETTEAVMVEAINNTTIANTKFKPISGLADLNKTVAQMVTMDIEGGRLKWVAP